VRMQDEPESPTRLERRHERNRRTPEPSLGTWPNGSSA
jgi:hypothetical protein